MPRSYTRVCAALVALAAAGCSSRSIAEPAPRGESVARSLAADVAIVAAPDASMFANEPREAATVGARVTLPFVEHAVSRCALDRLADSAYLRDWVEAGGLSRVRPAGDPVPSPALSLPTRGPDRGEPGYAGAEQALVRALREEPQRSHMLDCTLSVPSMGERDVTGAVPYTVYLPEDYLANPTRRRAVLLLAPGGRGDRTRWWLTPAPGSRFTRGTGGLSLRTRLDAWARAHEGSATPLVVTVDGPTGRWVDGPAAFLGRHLPAHLVATFLPHQREEETPLGVQAISLGAAWVARVLFENPARYASVGLSGTYCDVTGMLPERDFGTAQSRARFYGRLAERVRAGSLAVRMDIGRRDRLYDCNKRWYFDLQSAGVFPAQREPVYERCERPGEPPDSGHCVARWPGFTALPGLGHHYAAVVPVFEEDLAWQLDRLASLTPAPPAR